MTKEELIKEAKRRYPPGTKFIPAHLNFPGDVFCISTEDSEFIFYDNFIYLAVEGKYSAESSDYKYGNNNYNRLVYCQGKWAEIISESSKELEIKDLKEGEIYQYIYDEYVCIAKCKESGTKIGSGIKINGRDYYRSNNFAASKSLKPANASQKKHVEVCIKHNKYIPESDLDKYDDTTFELKQSNVVCGVELIPGEMYYIETAFKRIIRFERIDANNVLFGNAHIGLHFTEFTTGYRNPVSDHKLIRKATEEEKQHLEACIKAGKYVDPPSIKHAEYYKCIKPYDGLGNIGSIYKFKNDSYYMENLQGERVLYCSQTPGEILEWFTPSTKEEFEAQLKESKTMKNFKVGDKVEAISAYYGWSNIKPGDIGVVREILLSEEEISVDFPNRKDWKAKPSDLELAEFQFQIGKWYEYLNGKYALKCSKNSYESIGIYYSEYINLLDNNHVCDSNHYKNEHVTTKEIPIEKLQKYLPDGHIDKIKKAISVKGRYLKTLVDSPDGGNIKAGEIGLIKTHRNNPSIPHVIDFPSHKDYYVNENSYLHKGFYELMPEGFKPTEKIEYVKCIKTDTDRFILDKVYVITNQRNENGFIYINILGKGEYPLEGCIWAFEPCSKEEYDAQELKDKAFFKVGDWVRVTRGGYISHSPSKDPVFQIENIRNGTKLHSKKTGSTGWIDIAHVVKALPHEIPSDAYNPPIKLGTWVEVIKGGGGALGANGFIGQVCTKTEALSVNYGGESLSNTAQLYVKNESKSWGLCEGLNVVILHEEKIPKTMKYKKGDKVKVLRKVESNSEGWTTCWVSEMDDTVGTILTVLSDEGGTYGALLSNNFYYPRHALELVTEEIKGWVSPTHFTVPLSFSDSKSPLREDKKIKRIDANLIPVKHVKITHK